MTTGHRATPITFDEVMLLFATRSLVQEVRGYREESPNKFKGKGKGKLGKDKPKKEKADEGVDSLDEDTKKKRKHEKKCFYCDQP